MSTPPAPAYQDPQGGFFDTQKRRSFTVELVVIGAVIAALLGAATLLVQPLTQAIVAVLPAAVDEKLAEVVSLGMAQEERASAFEQARVARLFAEVLAAVPAEHRAYVATATVVAIDNDTINAMASPGGHVFVYTGLMDQADDDGLRGVLAHEVAHAVYRHGLQGLVRSQLFNLGLAWLLGDVGELEKLVVGQGASLLSLAYSRAQEDECDGYALQLADAQGWSLVGMVKLYRAFPESGAPELLATHPDSADRARRIEEHLARR
jgi:Zn-dependent protease with chaperone function